MTNNVKDLWFWINFQVDHLSDRRFKNFVHYWPLCFEYAAAVSTRTQGFVKLTSPQVAWLSVKSIHPSNDVLTYDFDQIGADTAISSHAQLPINIIMICVQCNNIPDDITAWEYMYTGKRKQNYYARWQGRVHKRPFS